MSKRNRPILFLLLIAGLCLPQVLRGQSQAADTLSSIVGKTFYRMEIGMGGLDNVDVPVSGIDVVLVAGKDTARTKTDNLGRFSFSRIKTRQVTLSMVDDDYAPFSESFVLMPGENVVIVPRQRETETLDAASVTAEVPVMTMKGDTLVYHANALTVNEGDYAIDLLKQMPGVEVDRTTGIIRISGKEVARSYVNGALVFGLNPMDPMENLRAEQVVTMEVYDEKNPLEVLDNIVRDKQRVVNIKTKDPIFSTTDLQVRAIAGMDETKQEDGRPQYRYGAGTNAHFFSELIQLYADVMTNNVGMNSSSITATPGPQTNYRAMTDLTMGLNKYWESPLYGNGFDIRYSYSRQRMRSRNRTLQEYFETAGIPEHDVENETSTSGRSEQHRIETGFAYRTGKLAIVTWRQMFSLTHRDTDGRTRSSTSYSGMDPMLRDETSFSGDKNWMLTENVNVGFKARNNKPGPNLSFNVSLRQNDLASWNLDTLASTYAKRYLTKEGNGLSQDWMGNLAQTLYSNRTDGRDVQLSAEYYILYQNQDQKQEAYDLYGAAGPTLNPANTFDYTYSTLQQNLRLRSRFGRWSNSNTTVLILNVAFQMDRVIDKERIPEAYSGDKTYYGIIPMISFSTRRVSFTFNSQYSIPYVEQLRRRIDDTRPLFLTAGNPDLKKSQTYVFGISKGRNMQAKKWTTTWNVNFQYQRHPSVQRTIFYREETVLDDYYGYLVPAGATLNRTENADHALTGYLTMNASSRLSLLKGKLKPTVTFVPRLDYRQMPQYFGEVLDRTTEWTPSLNTTMTAPLWKGAQASVAGNVAYIRATSQEGSMDRKAIRGQFDLDFSTEFLKHAYFTGNYSWRPVRDLSVKDMSQNFQQLNLALGLNFLQKDLKVCIRGIDLLRSGSVYTLTMGPSYVTHAWTPVYGRYFVLDISYRFNNSGGRAMPPYKI